MAAGLGYVPTPEWLVEFMVGLVDLSPGDKVLEPACAHAPFLSAVICRCPQVEPLGIELDGQRLPSGIPVLQEDYLLWDTDQRFDLVIGNPPYGIVGDGSHYPIPELRDRKRLYRRRFTSWYGKYNLYGAFIEKSLQLLKPTGHLVFVVPSSWMLLDDFHKLRELLIPYETHVYHLGPKVFPGRTVDVCVVHVRRGNSALYLHEGTTDTPLIAYKPYSGEWIRFLTEEWRQFERDGLVLGAQFEIRFAARSPEFRPFVQTEPADGLLPVLTGRNLQPGRIDYETCYSGWWIARADAYRLRPFYAQQRLVVAHTKGTRCVAAIDDRGYPWREEFHLLPAMDVDLVAVCHYLNSERVQRYLREVYREIVPHLTRRMLVRIPIPYGGIDER